MYQIIKLFASFAVLLLTSMCTIYDPKGAVVSPNGLICQTRTDLELLSREQIAECYYQCPDGTVIRPEIDGGFSETSLLYSAPQQEVDTQLCSENLAPTPTITPTVSVATAEPTASPTAPTPPTPTLETPIVEQSSLLRGDVSMCDVVSKLINFRLIEPVPDLTGRSLEVQIGEQPTTCSVNPANTSLLTCTIPADVTFPSSVLVRLDGAVVNDFIYDGVGCARITTPFPTPAP